MKYKSILGFAIVIALAAVFWPASKVAKPVKEMSVLKRHPTSLDIPSRAEAIRALRAMRSLNFTGAFRPFANSVKLKFNEKVAVNIGRDYDLSLEYRATSYGRYDADLGERVTMVNGFIIYRPKGGNLSVEDARRFDDQSFPVVMSPNNSMVGLLTGRLIIKTRDPNYDVEAELGLKRIYRSDWLALSYVKIPEGTDLFSYYEELKQIEAIERADLEVLQGGVVPR